MKRRDFITKAGVAAGAGVVAASTLSTPALASKKVELNIVSTWGRDFPGLGTGAQRLAKRVQEVSGGEIVTNYLLLVKKLEHLTPSMKLLQVTLKPIMLLTITGKESIQVGHFLHQFLMV